MQPQDFNSMQEKALQYAREMQQKSQNYQDDQPAPDNRKSVENHRHNQRFEQNNYNYNNSFGSIKNIFSGNNTNRQNANSDLTLILSLILMLSSDGGDRLLILALLYIMS
ncbi:MAG: hypothetical protein J6L62_07535 [Clostridia bacterium]|nr:hypothetical protein [Clostridia bacterium]